ncbi:PREDICTED: uncharacterized protein LOC104605487 [Nelumbo nucifera]|uniref:Phytocyanin domain-containing protein n=2 Tax=Nelumbo nucifera TaxID=4432 RepID=A0A822Z9C0_NELNU|nr:PREDICTED: uncharacterized protein LOC104605487 [Nelumbo nucifera]DAD41180.1 TPA_asm: hypothetical protein HUJ06_015503 [Nelumbo nucifera]
MATRYNKLGISRAGLILLVTAASLLTGCMGRPSKANRPNTIVVGGSQGWRFGFNYTDWAFENGPFYLNDTLVFKYDAPNSTTFPHSVYLLPDFWSFLRCDLRRAKQVGNAIAGGGDGFRFVLNRWQPYFFACGERNGFHCKAGLMKFVVLPFPRCHG